MAGKLGRSQPHTPEEAPRLSLARYLSTAVPTPPKLIDYVSRVADWPMYANDRYGDCVWAMTGHDIEATTTYGQGQTIRVSEAALLKGYSDVTGFNPNDPSTDNGTVMQDALNYWRKTGVGGHKILAFAELNPKNMDEVRKALFLFGHVLIGIDFPRSAMAQFDAGKPWDIVDNDGGLEGGHAINVGLSDEGVQHTVVTWGKTQVMTQSFWNKYVQEAWIAIDQDWIDANGNSPMGLNVQAMNEDFTSLTGKAGPFPVTKPTPSPAPVPVPTPNPVPTPAPAPIKADLDLAKEAHFYLTRRHTGLNQEMALALRAWLTARHL